jgi:hypothetical protein
MRVRDLIGVDGGSEPVFADVDGPGWLTPWAAALESFLYNLYLSAGEIESAAGEVNMRKRLTYLGLYLYVLNSWVAAIRGPEGTFPILYFCFDSRQIHGGIEWLMMGASGCIVASTKPNRELNMWHLYIQVLSKRCPPLVLATASSISSIL